MTHRKRLNRQPADMLETIKFPTFYLWSEAIKRWSTVTDSGEKRIICAILAQAATDLHPTRSDNEAVPDPAWFFGETCAAYCSAVGICPAFLRERIMSAEPKTKEKLTLCAN